MKKYDLVHVHKDGNWQDATILKILPQPEGKPHLRVKLWNGLEMIAKMWYLTKDRSEQEPKQLNLFD